MNEAESLVEWWRTERDQVRTQLREKAKTQPLSEVETMILNPYTLEQARNQVIALNRLVGDYTGKKRCDAPDILCTPVILLVDVTLTRSLI